MNRSIDNRDRRARNNKLNNNIPRNQRIPRGNTSPHPDNVKSQARDVYSNSRFCDIFGRLKGCPVYVQVKSGITHEGILHTISQKGEVVLIEACTKDQTNGNMNAALPKLILMSSSIVKITAKDVDLEYPVKSETFATDSEISQRVNGQLPDRKLEEWCGDDESTDERLLDAELESDVNLSLTKGNGWDANEMFATNQRKFGYTSTYEQDLKEYTTPLDSEDTKEFRERRARAEKLAKEIEQSPDHTIRGQIENNDEITEEERFSSVSRVGPPGPNSRPESMGSSNNTNKYVPPMKRQGNMGAPTYPRGGVLSSGPGRPPMMPADRQPLPQGPNQPFRQPPQQQQQQQPPKPSSALPQQSHPPPAIHSNPPPPGHIGAMSNEYSSRVQLNHPHHTQGPPSQVKPPHHLNQQQPPYTQRPPAAIPDRVSPVKGASPTMGQQKPYSPEHEHSRIPPMMSEKAPAPTSDVGVQRQGMISHHQQQQQQHAPLSAAETAEKNSRTKDIEHFKQFSENLTLNIESKPDASRENKVPPGPTPLHHQVGGGPKAQPDVIPPQQPQSQLHVPPGGPSGQLTEVPQHPETKVASTSPLSQSPAKGEPQSSSEKVEKTEAERVQSLEKPTMKSSLNPNAQIFQPRVSAQKTPTPPPSRTSPPVIPNHMVHHQHPHSQYMTAAHPQVLYGQVNNGGQHYLVTSNSPASANLQQYHFQKQLQSRGGPRAEFLPSPFAAAGQPLVAPGLITVTPGQQGGHLKMVQPVINHQHMLKQQQMAAPYRAMQAANPAAAVQAIHPQSQQMVPSADGVMMQPMMAYQSQAAAAAAAAAQSQQPLQQQQGQAPPNHYIHGPPGNAANQMQHHHTTPPLAQQSQQTQGNNHSVMAPQGQFPQHGGRPSPGPMQQQMAHAQAQGLPQLVAVSQGGQQTIVYTSLQQSQHGHGMPNQHANQQYSNMQQHMNQPNMQVQPTHVPSSMTNITNVTRVHPEPHPHPHAAAPVYMSQSAAISNQAMVPSQHQVTYMPQHAYNQPGN